MARNQFSYTNSLNIKSLFFLLIIYLLKKKKNSKNHSRFKFLQIFLFIKVHPSLYLWMYEMGIWNQIHITANDH